MILRMTQLALAAALVAGCGGGGSDRTVTIVPDEAVQSSEAFTEFVGERRASETKEPLAMNESMPPTSETAEPIDID